MTDLLAALGIGTIGIVGIIVFIALIFALATAFTAFFVALIWNWIGLYTLFGLGPLSFWQVIGVAAALNLIRGILNQPSITTE